MTLLIVAKHWVKLKKKPLERLRKRSKALDTTTNGMTAKNKKRLRQFDDQDKLQALIELPRKLKLAVLVAQRPVTDEEMKKKKKKKKTMTPNRRALT